MHWAIALRLQKPSSRWTKDRSCTNIHTGPLKGDQPPDSIVYSDGWKGYNVPDVSDFHHFRINHSELFADDQTHINGI